NFVDDRPDEALRLARAGWELPTARRGGRGLRTDDSALRALAGARVGVGALAADREALAVTEAAVATEIHQALDVHGRLAAQVAFDLVVRLDELADLARLVLGEVLGAKLERNLSRVDDVVRGLLADSVDVLEGDHHALLAGEIDAGDASHASLVLVAGV